MNFANVKEIRLQKIWEKLAFSPQMLETTTGESLHIINHGSWNNHNGPDFLNAEILINSVQHFGAIEIHINASDWNKHHHQKDARYNQVILHVVWNDDVKCLQENGESPTTLCLKTRIPIHALQSPIESKTHFPCEDLHHLAPIEIHHNQLQKALSERMAQKVDKLQSMHRYHHCDWWYTALWSIGNAWMGKANEPMTQLLMDSVQKIFILRHQHATDQLSYWLGISGLLKKDDDGELITRFQYLSHLHGFKTIENPIWNTRQLRPSSFPKQRLMQWSAWLSSIQGELSIFFNVHNTLFKNLKNPNLCVNTLKAMFQSMIHDFTIGDSNKIKGIEDFSKQSNMKKLIPPIGEDHIEKVILNGLIPLWKLYAKENNKPDYNELAELVLNNLQYESNHITKQMLALFPAPKFRKSAAFSQSLIAQHQQYCSVKQCKQCRVGNHVLSLPFMTTET